MSLLIISHRGNISGPVPSRENSPSYIDSAILSGYEVEVDVNYINGKFYLGHDTPDIEISETWIRKRKEKLWFHCKNLSASSRLIEMQITYNETYKFFCHTSDSFILTSTNHMWVHDLSLPLNILCIIPLLREDEIKRYHNKIVYAVCTDYVSFAAYNLKQKGLYD